MSKNKVIKSISFNKTNKNDSIILNKILTEDFNFSGYVKKLILDDIRRDKMKVVQKSEKGGIKIVLG